MVLIKELKTCNPASKQYGKYHNKYLVVVRTLHSSPSYAGDGELRKLCKPRTSYASYASYLKKVLKSV